MANPTHNRYITDWIDVNEARMLRMKLIVEKKYTKDQCSISSCRWADPNDHDKGYLARVHVVGGIHPELELGDTGRKKKTVSVQTPVVTSTTVGESTSNSPCETVWYGTECTTYTESQTERLVL